MRPVAGAETGTIWCVACQMDEVAPRRVLAGFITCLRCGEEDARRVQFCVVPTAHKSAYGVVSDPEMLKALNKYRPV